MNKTIKSYKESLSQITISDCVTYFLLILVFFHFMLGIFLFRGTMELGEECTNCINGKTFTTLDLFSDKNITVGSIFSITFSVIVALSIILSIEKKDEIIK